MQIKGLLGFAAAVGLGALTAGCAQQTPSGQAMATPAAVQDTGSMQIPDSSMGNLRQGAPGPGTFQQAAPTDLDTGSMQTPDRAQGNLRRTPNRGARITRQAPAAPDVGSMQIPDVAQGNLRR